MGVAVGKVANIPKGRIGVTRESSQLAVVANRDCLSNGNARALFGHGHFLRLDCGLRVILGRKDGGDGCQGLVDAAFDRVIPDIWRRERALVSSALISRLRSIIGSHATMRPLVHHGLQEPSLGASGIPANTLAGNLVILIPQNVQGAIGLLALELALFLAMLEMAFQGSPIREKVSTRTVKEVGVPMTNVEIAVGELELAVGTTRALAMTVGTDVNVAIGKGALATAMHLVVEPIASVDRT